MFVFEVSRELNHVFRLEESTSTSYASEWDVAVPIHLHPEQLLGAHNKDKKNYSHVQRLRSLVIVLYQRRKPSSEGAEDAIVGVV